MHFERHSPFKMHNIIFPRKPEKKSGFHVGSGNTKHRLLFPFFYLAVGSFIDFLTSTMYRQRYVI